MSRKEAFTSRNKVFVKRKKYKKGYFNVATDESGRIIGKQKWSRRQKVNDFRKDFDGYELNIFPKTKDHGVMYERNFPESAKKYIKKKQDVQVLTSIKVKYKNKLHSFARASKRRPNDILNLKTSMGEALNRAEGLAVSKLDIPYREVRKRTVKRSFTYRVVELRGKSLPSRTKTVDAPQGVRV